jgi:SAM-dependent methyltransferase
MRHNSLYHRPDLYDLMAPHDPVLERFYVEMACERGGRVLDLACGSGRLTVPLARTGLQVTGGDLSTQMLQHARRQGRSEAVDLDLVELDMRDFDLKGRTFDTIIVAINSILHLHSLDEFEGFFRSVARHLSAEGRLVFDAFLPSFAMLSREPGRRELAAVVDHATLGKVTVEEALTRYDPPTQVSYVDWYWSTERERDFFTNSSQLRSIFPQEMPLLIASGGLRLVECFGDFDRSPLTAASRRQVCVCAR